MTKFKGHKTIKVEELKTYINELLANKKIAESEKIAYMVRSLKLENKFNNKKEE